MIRPHTIAEEFVILAYPATGPLRVGIARGEVCGHRHALKVVDCGCGRTLLARFQRGKARGTLCLPSAKEWQGDTPVCEACHKPAAGAKRGLVPPGGELTRLVPVEWDELTEMLAGIEKYKEGRQQ